MDRKLIVEKIVDYTIPGIISTAFPIILPLIYSYMTKTPLKTMLELPIYIYVILFIPLILWIIYILIKAKMEESIEYYLPNYMVEYISFDTIEYKKIIWIIEIPKKYKEYDISVIKDHFRVSSRQKCKICGTELEYGIFHIWKCVNCNSIKLTLRSKDRLISRAEKIFKRKLEHKEEELIRISEFIDMINFQFGTYYGEYEIDLIQQLMMGLINKDLIDEIDNRTKDEFKPLFEKYYNKELRNRTESNENFFNDITNNIELRNLLEDLLIDDMYEKYEFIKLLN